MSLPYGQADARVFHVLLLKHTSTTNHGTLERLMAACPQRLAFRVHRNFPRRLSAHIRVLISPTFLVYVY